MDGLGELLARLFSYLPAKATALMLGGLLLAGGAGFLTAAALGTGSADPARTVTLDIPQNGPTGPSGPTGPTGPKGEPGVGVGAPGDLNCPVHFSPGVLVINHPGGSVAMWTCLAD